MPWLASTAFLHSVMVQEKKNMLRVWNAILVSLAFCLSLFGTFLTRSGVLSSIHSFAQSSIGPWFLGFICVAAAFSTALIFWRLPLLRSRTRLESLASRAAAFLYNNLLLVAYTFSIFVLAAIALEFTRGTRARKALGERTWAGAFSSLVGRNRRRYGGYVVHAAIVLLAIGVAGGAYGATKVQHLKPDQSMTIRGYRLHYLDTVGRRGANDREERARLVGWPGNHPGGGIMAGKDQESAEGPGS